MRAKEFIVEADSYSPPTLNVGDRILKGKFKNSPAEIKGFTQDKHNQPVLKTNRGEVQLFKPRVTKLMDKDVAEGYSNTTFNVDRRKLNVPALIQKGAILVTHPHGEQGWETDNKEDWAFSLLSLYNVLQGGWTNEAKKYLKPASYKKAEQYINSSAPNLGSDKLVYDGKYNQILWSIKKLGIPDNVAFLDKDQQGVAEGQGEQDYLSQVPNLTWKPVSRSVWNTIQDEGLDEEQDAPKHTDWIMASLIISSEDARALQAFDSDVIEDFNRFDIHLKSRHPGLTDLIDYDNGNVTIVKPSQMQGVAEGVESLDYQGNCTEDEVVDEIFGDVNNFARMVEEHGDEFTVGKLVVKYDPETDIHSFYYKKSGVAEGTEKSTR